MKQTAWRWLVPIFLGALLCSACPAWTEAPQPNPGRHPCWPGQVPADDTTEKFTFAILGDKTSGGEGKWPIFDRAVDAINLLAPDFVITTGDHIPGHMEEKVQWTEEWREYREHAARLRPPLWLIPGNHDIANTACHRFWQEDLGDTYYAFTHKGCLFLVLNTEEERFDGRGPVWRAMMDFAKETLLNHQESRHSFIFFHKPMWDDPRFAADWEELEQLLGDRPCTVIAGHEHYLSTERRGNKLLVIQNATGGGIHLSNVREYGCFHAFAFVTVEGRLAHYAVIEPDGGVWPPEIAPAAFRKQVTFGMVSPTAELPERLPDGTWRVDGRAELANPFDTPVTLQLRIGPLSKSGWKPAGDPALFPPACGNAGKGMQGGRGTESASFPPACGGAGGEFIPGNAATCVIEDDELVVERRLEPGGTDTVPLVFTVPEARLPYPPALGHRVNYKGEWLEKESYRMIETPVAPLYPAGAWRNVGEWRLAGPLPLGELDPNLMATDPRKAFPGLFASTGMENGPGDGDTAWRTVQDDKNGLLNGNALLGTQDLAAAFFACAVKSPEARTTHAVLYADNFALLYLNGKPVEGAMAVGAPGGFVYVPLALKAGWNRLVVKLANNRGDWFARLRIADPENALAFAADPQD